MFGTRRSAATIRGIPAVHAAAGICANRLVVATASGAKAGVASCGSCSPEYANFQALKYKDSTQGLPKEQRCFFAGHWHVSNDVRAQMGPGRMLVNKLVEVLVDALRAGES